MGGSLTSNPVSAYVARKGKLVRTPIVSVDRLLARQGAFSRGYKRFEQPSLRKVSPSAGLAGGFCDSIDYRCYDKEGGNCHPLCFP